MLGVTKREPIMKRVEKRWSKGTNLAVFFFQLTVNKDQKLLHQLGFSDDQALTVKTLGGGTPSSSTAETSSASSSNSTASFSSSYAMDQVRTIQPQIPQNVILK